MDLGTFVRVATEITKGDTSTGWVYCILGIHHFWIGYVEPELQHEIWGKDSNVLMADSFAPVGKVQPVSGGYRLSGRWSFLSGLWCSDWVAVGAVRTTPRSKRTDPTQTSPTSESTARGGGSRGGAALQYMFSLCS